MNLLCLRSWIITSLNIVYLKNRMSLLTHVFNYFFSSLLSCLNTNGLLAFKASSLSPCPQYAHLSPHRRACNIDLSPANPLPFYSQAHKRSCKCTLLLIPSVSLFMQLPLPGITFLPLTICAPQDPQILLYVSLCLLFTGLFFPMDS